jgi:hypothetical protein
MNILPLFCFHAVASRPLVVLTQQENYSQVSRYHKKLP